MTLSGSLPAPPTLQREQHFVAAASSAAAARSFVLDTASETRVDLDDLALLTAELVNNAIVHARTAFTVQVSVTAGAAVIVAISNHAPELLLLARTPSGEGGRGLALIDAIADAWGFERHGPTKLVWFRLLPDATAV